MEHLIERLRTLSRPSGRPHQPVDVRGPLREAIEFLDPVFDDKGVKLVARLGETAGVVRGDPGELEQLFANLLMNAHEATPAGGTVSVTLTSGPEHFTVSIADTGVGIPADLLDRIFDPFVTTKQRGAGLGLAISSGIAESHGARLRATNQAAGGALFTVDFQVGAPVENRTGP